MIAIRIQKVEDTIKLFEPEIERQRAAAYNALVDLNNALRSKMNTAQKDIWIK